MMGCVDVALMNFSLFARVLCVGGFCRFERVMRVCQKNPPSFWTVLLHFIVNELTLWFANEADKRA